MEGEKRNQKKRETIGEKKERKKERLRDDEKRKDTFADILNVFYDAVFPLFSMHTHIMHYMQSHILLESGCQVLFCTHKS